MQQESATKMAEKLESNSDNPTKLWQDQTWQTQQLGDKCTKAQRRLQKLNKNWRKEPQNDQNKVKMHRKAAEMRQINNKAARIGI